MHKSENTNRYLTLLFVFVFSQTPLAQGAPMVLLQATTAAQSEYEMVLESNHEYRSFADDWLERHEELQIRNELKNAFALAQQTFLQSEISSMKPEWERVFAFAYKADWPILYSEMIQTAGMRMAQLGKSTSETEKWLRLVAEFNPKYEPQKDLFPPPIIEQYNRVRSRMPTVQVALGAEFDFDRILINGRPQDLERAKTLSLPDAMARVTFLSSKFAPVTRVIPSREIKNFKPAKFALVTGTCEAPALNISSGFDLNMNDVALVYSRNCVTTVRRAQLAEKPSASPEFSLSAPMPAPSDEKTPLYKSGWFWVGAAALVSAVVLSLQPKNSPSAEPSHTEGY